MNKIEYVSVPDKALFSTEFSSLCIHILPYALLRQVFLGRNQYFLGRNQYFLVRNQYFLGRNQY